MLDEKDLGASDDEASHQDCRAARALNNEGTDASKSPRDLVTEQRKRLRDTGFAPIPVAGKKPVPEEWQKKTTVTDTEIETWSGYKSTGLITRLMPALDVDIYNPEAAKAVEELVRERYKDAVKYWYASATRPSSRFRSAPINPSRSSGRSSSRRRAIPRPLIACVMVFCSL